MTGLAMLLVAVPASNAAATEAIRTEIPAATLSPRETALVQPQRWSYSVGVFNPLTMSLGGRFEVQTHPLLFFISPNVIVRAAHLPLRERWGLTG